VSPRWCAAPTLDVIAANALGRALYSVLYTGSPTAPNLARFTFLNPQAQQFWRDWDQVADDYAAHMRAAAGANPYDRTLTDLVGELSTRSDAFRQLWARHDVRAYDRGTKNFQHPVVGELDLRYDVLQPAAEPGLTIITYTAEPGTTSHDNLVLLASWAASQDSDTDHLQAAPLRRD
jgi:MmyB-like transcription regulator ligand binding domain